jgi:mannan endo-1,4-beta-mannosidase
MVKHRSATRPSRGKRARRVVVAIVAAAAIAAGIGFYNKSSDPSGPLPAHLPATPQSYLGVYTSGLPGSYAAVSAFSGATGAKPDVVMFYSGWYVPFPVKFAKTVAANGAVPLVQMDPDDINVAAIASDQYDGYLSSFAEAVRSYRDPVILSFGHEMNGSWYSWGYGKTSPADFVAAWRHVVKLFRALGATNVTWLWTVNIINNTQKGKIPSPKAWWPGSSYVDWVGIDGYYLKPSWQFAPLFGPTIADVRQLTTAPILIGETGAVPTAGQSAKITNLYAGVHAYGLLGFVWFNKVNMDNQNFVISGAPAFAAFGKGARAYSRPGS